ncbi:hypothetical protein A9Q77_11605 [Marinomonas sp. 42_23_T18]|nr:hypothetical protein A9Q77_11605 [Marinomonas sp. 42_23_T18]
MLLFKFKSNNRPIVGVSPNTYFNQIKLPKVSPLTLFLAVVLAALCWYPSFIEVQQKILVVKQKKQKLLLRDMQVQRLVSQTARPEWLSDYPWLTWHTEAKTITTGSNEIDSGKSPLLFYISLQGVASQQSWSLMLNKLIDDYSLQPKFEQIYWLESGLLDVNIELQLVPKKLAIKDYLFLPRRVYRDWPKNIEVLAALEWQNKRSLKIRIGELDLSLEQGDWVPELAANLVSLDGQRAVFRQQYGHSIQDQKAQAELVLEYLNHATLEGVSLAQDNAKFSQQMNIDILAYQNRDVKDEL